MRSQGSGQIIRAFEAYWIDRDEVVNYPIKFLNSLDLPRMLRHNWQLKFDSMIIMLRNLNRPKLCNGTRLAVKKLTNNLVVETIIMG